MNQIVLIVFLAAIYGAFASYSQENDVLQKTSRTNNVNRLTENKLNRREAGCIQNEEWMDECDDYERRLRTCTDEFRKAPSQESYDALQRDKNKDIDDYKAKLKECRINNGNLEKKVQDRDTKIEELNEKEEKTATTLQENTEKIKNLTTERDQAINDKKKADKEWKAKITQLEAKLEKALELKNETERTMQAKAEEIISLTAERNQTIIDKNETERMLLEKITNITTEYDQAINNKTEEIEALKLQHKKKTADIRTGIFTDWNNTEIQMKSQHEAEMKINEQEYNRTKSKLEAKNDQLQKDIEVYSRTNTNLTEELDDLKEKIKNLNSTSETNKLELDNANQIVENMERIVKKQNDQIEKINEDLNASRAEQTKLGELHDNRTIDLQTCQDDLENLEPIKNELEFIRIENEEESKCSSSNATVFKCYNQGRCRMQFNKFSNKIMPYCQCARGFTGEKCEDEKDITDKNTCY